MSQRRPITLITPSTHDLPRVVAALASFQRNDGGPAQLHPGDLGWNQKDGPDGVTRSVRVWERDDEPIVIGMLDTDLSVIRLAVSPAVADADEVALRLADDLDGRGILTTDAASAEVRYGAAVQRILRVRGWTDGDGWACFTSDLTGPIPDHGLRLAAVDGAAAEPPDPVVVKDIVTAHRAAWERSTFTTDKWHLMAAGPAFRQARFRLLYAADVPVATAAVWSAGRGRPGLIESLGVDRDHRGHGFGRAALAHHMHTRTGVEPSEPPGAPHP